MNQQFYENLLTNIQEGIYFVDKKRKITFWNNGAERITGFSSKEVLGKHCYDNILNHIDEEGNHLCMGGCPLHRTIQDGKPRHNLVFLHHKDGHRVPVQVGTSQIIENGQVIGAVEFFTDESNSIEIYYDHEELKKLAMHDQLTGLHNRRYLQSYLTSKIREFHELNLTFGIAFLDIDDFKRINDTYGHDMGDTVLQMFAKTCQGSIRQSDLMVRYGGEEFVCIFTGITPDGLQQSAEKLRILIESSAVRTPDSSISVTASIGATMVVQSDDLDTIIKRADQLMYHSKSQGKNRITID